MYAEPAGNLSAAARDNLQVATTHQTASYAAGGGAGAMVHDEKTKQEQAYWRRLAGLRPHRSFAARYITTLDKFMCAPAPNHPFHLRRCRANLTHLRALLFGRQREDASPGGQRGRPANRRQVAGNVRCYLAHFVQLCSETPDHYRHQPNLRMLDAISRTLEAVYRRMGINMRQVSQLSNRRDDANDDPAPQLGAAGPAAAAFAGTLPYNARALHWNATWTRNKEEKYCYCGENKQSPALQCNLCKNWFHRDCTTDVVPKDGQGFLPFQLNYKFACAICSSTGRERFELVTCSWIDSVMGAMGNLMYETQRDMFKVVEVGDHLDEHWDILCYRREKKPSWRGPLNSYFTNNKDRFVQEKPFWGLADPEPDGQGPCLQPCRVLRGHARPPPIGLAAKPAQSRPKSIAWRPPTAADRRTKSGRLVKHKNYTGMAEVDDAYAGADASMAQLTAPQAAASFAPAQAESDICGICNCAERALGNPSRNKPVCVKCEEERHGDPKIPVDKPVWEARVCKENDPIPYALYLCEQCNTQVVGAGCYDWQKGKQRIDASAFQPSRHADPTEGWVECEFCETWYHQVCARWEEQIHGVDWPVMCPNPACREKAEAKFGREKWETAALQISASDLPESGLSQHLEKALNSDVFADTNTNESTPHGVTVRVISNVSGAVDVADKIGARYKREPLPYMQKNIFAFYKCPDGSEIAFFALMAQEYGPECPAPNTNTAYISYLDSNQLYHCAGCNAHHDKVGADWWTNPREAGRSCSSPEACKNERRKIYHSLFIGYLDYLKQRGLERTYIWVMPPQTRDQDYVFFCRPKEMHIPTAKELEMWYIGVLEKAKAKGVITSFEDNTGRRLSPSASRTAHKDARKPGFLFRSAAGTPRAKPAEEGGAKPAGDEGAVGGMDLDGKRPAKRLKAEPSEGGESQADAAADSDVENQTGKPGFLDMDLDIEMGGMSSIGERLPLSPLSPRSSQTAGSDGTETPPRSLRHMPIFNGDFMSELVDEVLATVQEDEDAPAPVQTAGGGASAGAAAVKQEPGHWGDGQSGAARPLLKRSMSDALVDEVEKRMSNRRMGSYIVCYFDTESASSEMAIVDDPERSIDGKPPQTTLDKRENLVRLCADRHYQFNTMRHGKFSTMILLHYWMNRCDLKPAEKQSIQTRTESEEQAPPKDEAVNPVAGADYSAAANAAETAKWQQKLQERSGAAAPAAAPVPAAQAVAAPSAALNVRPCSTSEFDRLVVDELQPTLLGIGGGSDIQLQQVRSFVVGQRNQGLAPHIRCARLVSKLVPLLGIEAMTLATAAVVSIGRSQLERMVLDNLLPKLSQEQRYQVQALVAGGAGGLSQALRYAGGCVPLDLVSKEICDVVDFILTARNATAANA